MREMFGKNDTGQQILVLGKATHMSVEVKGNEIVDEQVVDDGRGNILTIMFQLLP
jgi:hypothetical protein